MGSKDKKLIVFMPYNAAMWDSLESVWMAANRDENVETMVIPIPYYDKNADGELCVRHYDIDKFPSYVPVVDTDNVDLTALDIDVIYIHNPYDQGNKATTVESKYYSKELKKLCKLLVYIPYYMTGGKLGETSALCLAYFYADYIIVQHEAVKQYFDERVDRDKLFALGSPKVDRVLEFCEKYAGGDLDISDFQAVADRELVLLLNTSIKSFLADPANYFILLSEILELAAFNKTIGIIWRPHPLLKGLIENKYPMYSPLYEELVEYFEINKLGMIDYGADLDAVMAVSDAYIGDVRSSLVPLFGMTGKPICGVYEEAQIERLKTMIEELLSGDENGEFKMRGLMARDRFRSVAANYDGTAGIKIHEFIMEKLG